MRLDIETHLHTHEFVTRPQLLDTGYDDRSIARLVRAETLCRIGPGLYAGSSYRRLRPEQQHILRCRAIATRFPDAVAFSHHSAALLHGADVWGIDLRKVHVTRLDTGRGRHQAGVAHHVAELPERELVEMDGLLVTNPTRTVWDVAVSQPREQGVVIADSMLHRGLTDDDALRRMAHTYTAWRGSRRARVTLTFSDGRSESVGESRSRLMFRDYGIPRPVLQFRVYDENGVLVGINDFAWLEFRHLGEFDGMMKYGSVEALAREKAREDALRSLGWGMTRLIWSQLDPAQRRQAAEHLLDAMKQSRRLYGPIAS